MFVQGNLRVIKSEIQYGSLNCVTSDHQITMDVIEGMHKFINRNADLFDENVVVGEINALKIKPKWGYNYGHCDSLISLFEECKPFVEIVEDHVNYHQESNLNKIYWERFTEVQLTSHLIDEDTNEESPFVNKVIKAPLLSVTKTAFEAIKNYKITLIAENKKNLETSIREYEKTETQKRKNFERIKQIEASLLRGTSTPIEKKDYAAWFKSDNSDLYTTKILNSLNWAAYFCCINPDDMTPIEYKCFSMMAYQHYGDKFTNSIKSYLPYGRLEEMINLDSQNSCFGNACNLF